MKKILSAVILHALLLPHLFAQINNTKYLDQQVLLKNCNISVKADHFIASTFMELEFYNPQDSVVEAYQLIKLKEGQVITGFQLELNGKFRDGSIEEKWKAIRAYSSIVGKRVDPAILEYYYDNVYKLHIYPVPAHGSRKVTINIDQLMGFENDKLKYKLPLEFTSVTQSFNLNINVKGKGEIPLSEDGFLKDRSFSMNGNVAALNMQMNNVKLDKPLAFDLPVSKEFPEACISVNNNVKNFVVRSFPNLPRYYPVQPSNIRVYWDVSASSLSRDIKRELIFLKQYITRNNITDVMVTLFNQKILKTVYLDVKTTDFFVLENYLLNYQYDGATNFDCLDFSKVKTDAILVFTDGVNSLGGFYSSKATVQVNCITSSSRYNEAQLRGMVSTTGGSVIHLTTDKAIPVSMKTADMAGNFLMDYRSLRNAVSVNQKFPLEVSDAILLSGTFTNSDHLQLFYGNNGAINKVDDIYLSENNICDSNTYRKIKMLMSYDSLKRSGAWYDLVYFGLQEKIITQRTSYLVLERTEDYIKYNIAPPKELEEECAARNYVYKSEYKIKALKASTQQDILLSAANNYNRYLSWWDPKAELIDLNKPVMVNTSTEPVKMNESNTNTSTSAIAFNKVPGEKSETGNTIKEVIITSAFSVKRTQRSVSSNVQYLAGDQLNSIRQNNINDALAGKVAGIQVRSQSAGKLGVDNIVRLRGENGFGIGTGPIYVVNGSIISSVQDINVDDIQDVTVLQGPSAAALFGPDGSNGAIVINLKKGRTNYEYSSWSSYKLKDMEDEDYLQDIRKCDREDIDNVYADLELKNQRIPIFYFDMSEYFFSANMKERAHAVMLNGIEACEGNTHGLLAAAYIYESWQCFDDAISIYKHILEITPGDIYIMRDLALAYFQKKDYQLAVNTYYQVIGKETTASFYYDRNEGDIKTVSLNEMNAIIAVHRDKINIDLIDPHFIRKLPLDLRVTVESNEQYMYGETLKNSNGKLIANMTDSLFRKSDEKRDRYHYISEYCFKQAAVDSYKLSVNSYNSYSYKGKIPVYVRVITFRNFQQAGQTLEVRRFGMENQYGRVEIAEIKR